MLGSDDHCWFVPHRIIYSLPLFGVGREIPFGDPSCPTHQRLGDSQLFRGPHDQRPSLWTLRRPHPDTHYVRPHSYFIRLHPSQSPTAWLSKLSTFIWVAGTQASFPAPSSQKLSRCIWVTGFQRIGVYHILYIRACACIYK